MHFYHVQPGEEATGAAHLSSCSSSILLDNCYMSLGARDEYFICVHFLKWEKGDKSEKETQNGGYWERLVLRFHFFSSFEGARERPSSSAAYPTSPLFSRPSKGAQMREKVSFPFQLELSNSRALELSRTRIQPLKWFEPSDCLDCLARKRIRKR